MMSRVRPVSPKEREQIIEALKTGESQNAVAKRFKRSPGTINNIAREAGLVYTAPKNANEARRSYAREGRIRLIEKALNHAETILEDGQVTAKTLYTWSMALAVLLDKRRQEDNDTTRRRGSISALVEALREGEGDVGAAER